MIRVIEKLGDSCVFEVKGGERFPKKMSEPQIALTSVARPNDRQLRRGHCMWHLGGQW